MSTSAIATVTIKFASRRVVDKSDGLFPVEVWAVYTAGSCSEARHVVTCMKASTLERNIKRAARGLRFDWSKHVELRTPAKRQ